MIPADLAARLRMINEASFFNTEPPVAGLQRAREIQAQLPELVQGQRFFATLQRTLPDGTFRALVAGQQMTLALNTAAKPGDTLELVVTETTPKAVFARLANPEAGAGAAATTSAQPALSQTGRLISFLLTGQPPPKPAVLAGNQPLLPAPPANGAPLVPVLRQALAQSGLFFESHQAQWLSGKVSLAALLQEPQAQQAPPPQPRSTPAAPGGTAPGTPGGATAATSSATAAAPGQTAAAERAPATAQSAAEPATMRAAAIPERILPLVHQQLDSLATQHYVWQGQIWPGQQLEWTIDDPRRERDGEGDDMPAEWNTTLRLTLPRLGCVEAQLHLTPAGVALRLRTDDADALQALEAGREALASALDAANVPLTGMVVEQRHDAG